jgi:hypothetical protein
LRERVEHRPLREGAMVSASSSEGFSEGQPTMLQGWRVGCDARRFWVDQGAEGLWV